MWCCARSTRLARSSSSTMPARRSRSWIVRPVRSARRRSFVGALGASNHTYVEATETQALPDWIGSHVRMYAWFGGVPEITVPDNLKTGVRHACFYEPDLNRTYLELARHYGTTVIPTRVAKPRDKAKVETAVQIVERWVLAPLRNQTFFSLAEVNAAIAALRAR